MCESKFHNLFFKKLKKLNRNSDRKFADVTVNIIEEPDSESSEANRNGPNSQLSQAGRIKEVRTHKAILYISSPYFEEVLNSQAEGPCRLDVVVKEGQGRLLEILISWFYDEDVVLHLCLVDLILLLEVAIRFADEHYLKQLVLLIYKLDVVDFDAATLGIDTLSVLTASSGTYLGEMVKLLNSKMSAFLAKYFFPIEENQSKHRMFMSLDYNVLLSILVGDEPVAASEASLLMFVNEWLEQDSSRATSSIIESLLTNIRWRELDIAFLMFGVSFEHKIFKKWDGFHSWIFKAVGYHGLPDAERAKMLAQVQHQSRTPEYGFRGWYMNKLRRLHEMCAIRYVIHMVATDNDKRLEPREDHHLIHCGMKITPTNISISPFHCGVANMSLTLNSSFSMKGMRFAVGIVPANRNYKFSGKYFNYAFARRFLKWTDPVQDDSCSLLLDLWNITDDLLEIVNEYGFYVCLLPITEQEFTELEGYVFLPKCLSCSSGLKIVGVHNCKRGYRYRTYPTCHDAKIKLSKATDYTV